MKKILISIPKLKRHKFIVLPDVIFEILNKIKIRGGELFIVGGVARDIVISIINESRRGYPTKIKSKDLDLEPHGLSIEEIKLIVESSNISVKEVGKSFGIIKCAPTEGFDIEIMPPRKENKAGIGHRGFNVEIDTEMTFQEAARRRDFTMNSMAINLNCRELVDPFNGIEDLQSLTIRHTSDAFVEDWVRVLRMAQFAARFDFQVAPRTMMIAREMEVDHWTVERVEIEFKKALMKINRPSVFFETLWNVGWIKKYFPLLAALKGCEQHTEWHPEGDVWNHTMLVVDAAAKFMAETAEDEEFKWTVMLAALCHDLGKAFTTEKGVDEIIRSPRHDEAGIEPTRELLNKIVTKKSVIDEVVALVKNHMTPQSLFKSNPKHGAFRRLACRVDVQKLFWLSKSDRLGSLKERRVKDAPAEWLLEKIREAGVYDEPPEPILKGRHLLALGFKPGPKIGELLKIAFNYQLETGETDPEKLAQLALKNR
ncbi:CCA tRNA nucleotidyltransferase [Candidatus Neomarinimicrobiota bacterium]